MKNNRSILNLTVLTALAFCACIATTRNAGAPEIIVGLMTLGFLNQGGGDTLLPVLSQQDEHRP